MFRYSIIDHVADALAIWGVIVASMMIVSVFMHVLREPAPVASFDDQVRGSCVAGGVVDAFKPDGTRDGRMQFFTCGIKVKGAQTWDSK